MVKTKLASAVLALTAFHSGCLYALGLGELSLKSSLNQPLQASVPLSDLGDLNAEQILVKLADRQAFENAGVDRSQFLNTLQFKVQVDPSGNGRILISTEKPVVEPYLDFIVETRWPSGRILREYTVLLDLPPAAQAPRPPVAAPLRSPARSPAHEPRRSGPVMRDVSPEPAPQNPLQPRDASEQQSLPQSSLPDTYRVQHHDTMWQIAARMRPSAYVTTQQTMMALLKKNPQAFIDGNVNRLKSGYVLQLPSEEEAAAMTHKAASAEVKRQDLAWRGESAPAAPDSGSAAQAPQLTAGSAAGDSASGEAGDVKFSVTGGGETGGEEGAAAQLKESLRRAEEEAEKARLENSTMGQRVAAMEEQIAALKALVEMKNDQLAALQSGTAPAANAGEEQALREQLAAASQDAERAAQTPDEADAGGQGAAAEADQNVADSAQAVTAGGPESSNASASDKSEAVQRSGAAPAQPEAPWYEGRIWWLLAALLAVLALLLLWLRQRTNLKIEETEFTPVAPTGAVAATTPSAGEAEKDTGDDIFSMESSFSESDAIMAAVADIELENESADANEPVVLDADDVGQPQMGDAAAEADIYAAYGRYDRAISLLQNAILQDPDNSELRVKLVDIYLDTHDRQGFDLAFGELQALGDAQAIARVKESMSAKEGVSDWLRNDDADLPLQNNAADAPVIDEPRDEAPFDMDAGQPYVEGDRLDTADGLAVDQDVAEQEFTLGGEVEEPAPVSNSAADDELASLDVDLADLDFDFDATTPEETAGDDKAPVFDTGNAAAYQEAEFAFDDDLGDAEGVNKVVSQADAETDGELNLELDDEAEQDILQSAQDNEPLTQPEAAAEFDLDEETLNLATAGEWLEGADEAAGADESQRGAEIAIDDLVFDEFDADLGAAAEDGELVTDEDHVSTKLDLARAYVDMGDTEGARDILEEVLQEGGETQQAEARSLLDKL